MPKFEIPPIALFKQNCQIFGLPLIPLSYTVYMQLQPYTHMYICTYAHIQLLLSFHIKVLTILYIATYMELSKVNIASVINTAGDHCGFGYKLSRFLFHLNDNALQLAMCYIATHASTSHCIQNICHAVHPVFKQMAH